MAWHMNSHQYDYSNMSKFCDRIPLAKGFDDMKTLKKKSSRTCLFADYHQPLVSALSGDQYVTKTQSTETRDISYPIEDTAWLHSVGHCITLHEVTLLGVVVSCQSHIIHTWPYHRDNSPETDVGKFISTDFNTPTVKSLVEMSPSLLTAWLSQLIKSGFWAH